MPKRIHVVASKAGIPYATRHEVLREAMDCLLDGLTMRDLPMHDDALFPEGNPWSSTLAKILEKTPPHSKYPDLPSPLSFLFRLGRGCREFDRKDLKSEILSSLNSVEHLVISPRFGRLLEPRINPWLWHKTENYSIQQFAIPSRFHVKKEKSLSYDQRRINVENVLEALEDEQNLSIDQRPTLSQPQ